jgi:hypothetical protein
MNQPDVTAELDALHRQARNSYEKKDLRAYMDLFAPDLSYKQPNGRVIGRPALAANVASQLASIEAVETTYVRDSLQVDGDQAVEVLTQTAVTTVRYLLFLRRTWFLKRRGKYTWTRTPEGWKIRAVDVLEETVSAGAA